MQSAVYDINPVFTHYRLISFERFNELMEKAELVITHSGVNSIISCMRLQKPLVIVPRLKKYGEHVDDHQKEIAEVMKQKYDVTVCEDLTSINTCIEVAQTFMYKPWISHNAELVNFIKQLVGG